MRDAEAPRIPDKEYDKVYTSNLVVRWNADPDAQKKVGDNRYGFIERTRKRPKERENDPDNPQT